ncbi:MAG: SDR family oxidoreductase, partial [Pseudomonadota bacterium]
FVDDVVADSDGGVDVVLNALAGEAMQRSLEVLRPFGRFVELGKQDLLSNTQIGLRPLRRNISYFAADLDELLLVQPHRARELFAGLANFFDDGQLLPPPVEVFDRECAIDAFRRMQASDHIGKIVVRPPKVASLPVQPRNSIGDGGWLISGGLGGLGLAAAEWLVEQGVPALWLTSRSGQPKDDDAERLAALLAKADIRVIGADVADQDRMTEVFDDIHASGHRLEGIIHGAAHFDDQTLGTLSPERIDAVLRPKAEGARVLDLLSQDHKPDHFILFSSLAARIGTPGQAAYVAANLALEQTARTRRSKGQPALAIAWGPIADFGYLDRDPRLRDQIGRQTGGGMLDLQDVRHTLGVILQGHDFGPVVTISAADWGHLARHVKMISSPVFQRLDRREPSGLADSSTLLDDLKDLSEGEARQRLICALLGEAAEILRQPECEVDPVRPMTDLGFDSLMAMDLKLSVEQSLGVSLPLVALGQETTITDLAVRLLTHIREPDAQSEETADLTDRLVTLHVEESDRSQPDKYAEAGGPENALPQLVGRG